MVRLVLIVAFCFLAVMAFEPWLEDPSFFYPTDCEKKNRCATTLTKWVNDICGKDISDECVAAGMAGMCCQGKCSCEDVRSKCCPNVTPPPL